MRRALICLALLILPACLAAGPEQLPAPGPSAVFDGQGREINEAALVDALREASIVILGEVHDNPAHHAWQARLVAALAPGGIAFEMVPAASEEGVQVYLDQGGAPGGIGPAIGWERMGWPDWALYRPVFEAAEGAYVAGGGLARTAIRTAIAESAALAWGAGAESLGLDQPLDPATRTGIEDEMIAAHCNKLPRAAAGGMVEAQRLRDASFAVAVERARQRGGNGRAVLITGSGHARTDRGAPFYLRRVAPGETVLSVGMVEFAEGTAPAAAAAGAPYDFVIATPPAERPDPCEKFG